VDRVCRSFVQTDIFELNNIERVAVLSGPKGAWFGRNTSGGVVQIGTVDSSRTKKRDVSADVI
jgi:outer membrane receptor protein involved in Fe transport